MKNKLGWILALISLLAHQRLATAAADEAPPTELPPPMSTLDLEWESVDEAESYELKLTPKDGGKALVFPVQENKISQRVPSGTYLLQIRSKDKTSGYFGSWSEATEIDIHPKVVELLEPKDQEVIPEPNEKRHDVTLKWQPINGVRNYHLRIWDENREEKAQEFITPNSSKILKLSAGHTYLWTVTVEDDKSVSYQMKPTPYRFTLLGKKLLPPVIDTKISRTDVKELKWQPSARAETYRVLLQTKCLDETDWRTLADKPAFKERRLALNKLKPGDYRFEIVAEAPHAVSSEPAKFEFTVKPSAAELVQALE